MDKKYILKHQKTIIENIEELKKNTKDNKKVMILYLYNEKEEQVSLKNIKMKCYGVKIGNIYSTLAINIKENNISKEEQIFDNIIKDVKKYLKNKYPMINFENEYTYKNGFKSMYCKFNKDNKTDEYRTYIENEGEFEHINLDKYKEKLEQKIREVKLYLQLILILTKQENDEINGKLTYNIKQLILEKQKPKPLF